MWLHNGFCTKNLEGYRIESFRVVGFGVSRCGGFWGVRVSGYACQTEITGG